MELPNKAIDLFWHYNLAAKSLLTLHTPDLKFSWFIKIITGVSMQNMNRNP